VSKTALLQNVGLFQGIHSQDLTVLAQTLVVKRYKTGQLVFKQGDVGSTMYIVFHGQVNIYLPASPDNLPLQMMEPGDHFGELALFDNGPRSASALAMTNVVLLELTQQELTAFILERPHIALTLLATLSDRLRATNSLLSQRAARNVEAEVDDRLTWQDRLADKVAELNGSWAFIIVLIGLIIGWVLLNNGEVFSPPFDPYPFVFFNLILAIVVALQGPLIVMSQNRRALKDRLQAETDFRVNLKNEVNIERLLHEMSQLSSQLSERSRHHEPDRNGSHFLSNSDPEERRSNSKP
jgi:CRP/FNR family cyclic AMP-dependent transcriptional regulator